MIAAELGHALSFSALGATVAFTPQTVTGLTNGSWIFSGPLTFKSPVTERGIKTVSKGFADSNLATLPSSAFVIGQNLISEILGFMNRASLAGVTFSSSAVSGFQSFLQNRFEQYLVWGDLLNFNPADVFSFLVQATNVISVESGRRTRIPASSG